MGMNRRPNLSTFPVSLPFSCDPPGSASARPSRTHIEIRADPRLRHKSLKLVVTNDRIRTLLLAHARGVLHAACVRSASGFCSKSCLAAATEERH